MITTFGLANCQVQIPWTCWIIKSKCPESDMFARSILPWTWRMAKFKYFESHMFVISMLSWTWLTVKSKCNGLGWLLRPSALGLEIKLMLPWTWLNVKSKTLWVWYFIRFILPYFFGCVKEGLSFFWACPREDAHSLGNVWGLAHCQVQSCLGLASVKPGISRAWHTAKPSHF